MVAHRLLNLLYELEDTGRGLGRNGIVREIFRCTTLQVMRELSIKAILSLSGDVENDIDTLEQLCSK